LHQNTSTPNKQKDFIQELIVKYSKSFLSRWLSKESSSSSDDVRVLSERLFHHLLSLERKRSQRTGDPFVLMIIDLSQVSENETLEVSRICEVLRSGTRDTDLCGWYRAPSLFGMIFTALQTINRKAVENAISNKVTSALGALFDCNEMSRIQISFHYFPEKVDSAVSASSEDVLDPNRMNTLSGALNRGVKRAIDVAGSFSLLLVLSPLLVLIAVVVKVSSKGPVLFKQCRIGKGGLKFDCLKFRTMHTDCDHEIHKQYVQKLIQSGADREGVYKIVNDPRVTPIGKYLRKFSLDELPQLCNVLLGDMSLVGPRPPIPYEIKYYRLWHWRRINESKPGITGMWQVFGRSRTNFDDMVRLDIRYIERQSVLLDIKLLLMTPWVVITGFGAY
jgi:lipopolysaccharide/colanic/teichoic acid biosynthesis glycosyltransferase